MKLGMVGDYAASRQFEAMSTTRAQQSQIDHAIQAAQAAQVQAALLAD
jgi:hypothetical protein